MDPKLAAILTVLVIGLVSFFIGYWLSLSGYKQKFEQLNEEYDILKEENDELIKRLADAEKRNKQCREKSTEIKQSLDALRLETQETRTQNQIFESRIDSLKKQASSPSGKSYKEEYEETYDKYLEEVGKRSSLEKERLNWLRNTSPPPPVNQVSTPPPPPNSTAARFNSILSRIGIGNSLQRDDLTQINGIGPDIQKKLNDVGIYNFKQISEMNINDLQTLDDAIKHFPGRSLRDDWIGQAKNILKG